MNKLCKILSILMVLSIILCTAVTYTSSATYITIDGIKYSTINSTSLECAGVSTAQETVVIPAKVYGKSVTRIAQNAFLNDTTVKNITLPDSLTTIKDNAFSGCTSLESINIPQSVTTIGSGVFYNCSSLQSIAIPDSITEIKPYTFNRCSALSSVSIPSSVTSIGDYAFYRCYGLKNLSVPETVTTISATAFAECHEITLSVIDGSYAHTYATEQNITFETISFEKRAFENCDVNKDGYVNSSDVISIMKYITNIIDATNLDLDAMDILMDSTINIKDATMLQKMIVGLE